MNIRDSILEKKSLKTDENLLSLKEISKSEIQS